MTHTYSVVYEIGPANYSGFSPDIPGCASVGDTLEGMRANMREAIDLYREACVEFDEPIPEPVSKSITLPLEGETDPYTDPYAEYVVEWLAVAVPDITEQRTPQRQQAA